MQPIPGLLITLALLICSTNTLAAVFKCTSDTGAVTFTNTPCAGDQKVEAIEAPYIPDPRLQQIDHQVWIDTASNNAQATYRLADWAHRVAREEELALGLALKAQQLGHAEADNLVAQLKSTAKRPPADPAKFDKQLNKHVAGIQAARSNTADLQRDMQRQKDLGTIALALADYVTKNGRDALGLQLAQSKAFEWGCAGRDDCSTSPSLLGRLQRSGLAPDVRLKSCAPRLRIPCLNLKHFLAADAAEPTDFSKRGPNRGYEIMRVGEDEIWVTSRRAETIELLSVGITLPDPKMLSSE